MLDTQPRISEHPNRQFMTGNVRRAASGLPEAAYAAALDVLVIVCVDCIPMHDGKVLLSHRTREPHPSWWVNGGRMRKGELYGEAASRLMGMELGLRLAPDRFHLVGYYSLVWDTRAQEPVRHGCHTLSVAHTMLLTDAEVANLAPNEEYDATMWVTPEAVLASPEWERHPALLAMIRDLVRR